MVFHADADDRRSRAVARLAKWSDRADRWSRHEPDFGRPFPGATFARRRKAAAERYVEWVAGRDVAAGRLDDDNPAIFRVPGDCTEQRAAAYVAAVKHYCAAVVRLAGHLDDAAGPGRPAAGEGVPGEPPPEALPRHHRRWD
jgi:hypothetical protein